MSQRVRLLREGHATKDGRLIESGATSWRSTIIPLMVLLAPGDGHDGARLCGAVWGIRRETDGSGWITGHLDTTLNVIGLHCEADLGPAETAMDDDDSVDGPLRFVEARLAAVTLAQGDAVWDDMTIGAETDDDD